ncbi:MAG: Ig-like domain-containing protein, partial [Myxococcota bacterium]|nr:Ig-like domain-containing protein [Myxococcota bacterium]
MVALVSVAASGETLVVDAEDPGCGGSTPCFALIQDAIDAAAAGDRIQIRAGSYAEKLLIEDLNAASVDEADRIVLEADPAAPVGSVVLDPPFEQCTNGNAIRIRRSKRVTIRGLTVTGAGGTAVLLQGGSNHSEGIRIERNRIYGNGSGSCNGGIQVGRSNADIDVLNNLVYGNGRNGIVFKESGGGPHRVVGNTVGRNLWNGIKIGRNHVATLVNNVVFQNGEASGSGDRHGIQRVGGGPEDVTLIANVSCGNRLEEIHGDVLDATDAANLTPSGSEGSGVAASPGCEDRFALFSNVLGTDRLDGTADDDFTPVAGGPLVDTGADPRTLGLPAELTPSLVSDYAAAGSRPQDDDGDGTSTFTRGAVEGTAPPVDPAAIPKFRYVNNIDPACQGLAPCYDTIQAAVDVAVAMDTIRIQAGTYIEQVDVSEINNTDLALEADRVVIEADPLAPAGSVILDGAKDTCSGGWAVRFKKSRFVTVRGLVITGAGGRAVKLDGGSSQNRHIHIVGNRIHGNGNSSCNGGIEIARGNPETLIANNLIYGNTRNGIAMTDANGGPHTIVGNTIHANGWNGIKVGRSHEMVIANNLITANGTASGSTGGRFGVKREGSSSSQPEGITLLHNLLCANSGGEINGPALDPTDGGNLTPGGAEGEGVAQSTSCADLAAVYLEAAGSELTSAVDFSLAPGSPARDAGLDPRTLGLPPTADAILEADFFDPMARPQDGDGDGEARFDAGAIEGAVAVGQPPEVAILDPLDGALLTATPVVVSGTVSNADSVTVNGELATITGGTFGAEVALVEGANEIAAVATNAAGATDQRIDVVLDTPPTVAITAPSNGAKLTEAVVQVEGSVTDVTGLASLELNGTDILGSLVGSDFSAPLALALGVNPIAVVATDLAGSTATATITVERGEAPTVAITDPLDGAFVAAAPVGVSGSVTGTLPVTVSVGGTPATLSGSSFQADADLAEGSNAIDVTVVNDFGQATATVDVTLDTIDPAASIDSPADGTLTVLSLVNVAGTASDANGFVRLTLDGQPLTLVDGAFDVALPLALGANAIVLEAEDPAGNVTSRTISVTRGKLPVVTIDQPTGGSLVAAPTVTVSGQAPGATAVDVAGVAATLAGDVFTAEVALVQEGANSITVAASNPFGTAAPVSIAVRRDTLEPALTLTSPADGASLELDEVAVRGTATDANGIASVSVDGVDVDLDGASFQAIVPLAPGANAISVVVTDTAGRTAATTLDVTRLVADQEGPVIALDQPDEGALLASAEVVVSGRLTDESALESLRVNGEVVSLLGDRFTATIALAEGANAITLVARDEFGNESTLERSVTLDTTPPGAPGALAVTPSSPTNADRVTVTGSTEAGATVSISGAAAPVTVQSGSDGSFSASVFLATDTANRLSITATDPAGNEGPAAIANVAQDGTAPAVAIQSPADGLSIPAGTFAVLVAASDSSGVVAVEVNGTPGSAVAPGLFEVPLGFSEGPVTLSATAVDAASNTASASAAVTVVAAEPNDTTPPVVTIAQPQTGAVPGSPVAVSGSVVDQSTIVRLQVIGDDLVDVVPVGSTFSADVQVASAATIRVEAEDALGNVGVATVAVVVDTEPPAAPTLSSLDSPTASERILVRGSAEPGASVEVTGGREPATGSADAAGAFAILVDLARDQSNALSVVARDAVGNDSPAATATVVHDGVPPAVQATTPEADATQVPGTAPILVTFTESLDPPSAAPNARLLVDGVEAAATITVESQDRVVRIAPTGVLPDDAAVRVEIGTGIADRAGNALAAPFALAFATTDTAAPAAPVVSPLPPARTRELALVLEGSGEPGATIEVSGGAALASAPVDASGAFSISVDLAPNAINALQVSALDAGGNRSPPAGFSVLQDLTPPTPSFDPVPGSTGVAPTAALRIDFGEPVAVATLGGRIELRLAGQALTGQVVIDPDERGALFVPDQALAAGQSYTLRVLAGVRDDLGNASTDDFSSGFTVAAAVSLAAPSIDSVDPAGPTAAASVALGGTAPAGTTVVVSSPAATVSTAADAGGSWQAGVALAPDQEQEITARAEDGLGNASATTSVRVVQDGTAPVVTETSPGPGDTVGPASTVTVSFSEPIDPATVDGNVRLLVGGVPLAASVSLSSGGRTVALSPSGGLTPDTGYEIDVSTGVADLAGNALANAATAAFSTSGDLRRPSAPSFAAPATPTNAASVTLVGSGTPGDQIAVAGGASAVQTSVDAGGAFSLALPLTPDATNLLVVSATNPANGLSASRDVTVVQDATPPVLAVTSPADGSTVPAGVVAVTGSVSDATGVSELRVAGTAVTAAGGSFQATVTLVEGANSVSVEATDRAGNTATEQVAITFDPLAPGESDVDPPVVRIDAPLDGAVVGARVLVRGTVLDASPILAMDVAGESLLPDPNGVFVAEVASGGGGAIVVTATDSEGNVASASVTVVADLSPPSLSVDPAPATTADATLVLTGQTEPGARVEVASGDAVRAVTAAADGSFQLSVALRQQAPNLLLVSAFDAVGNRATPVDVTVVHDSQGPRVLATEPDDLATDVARDAIVQVTFDEPIDPLTLQSDSVTLAGRDGGIAGAVTLSPEANVLSFVPDARFEPGAEVVVSVSGALADLGGLALGSPFVASFRVAAEPTAIQGVVISGDGRPLQDVRVRVLEGALATRTDAQGNFRLVGVPAGRVTLDIDPELVEGGERFSLVRRDVQIAEGERRILGRPIILTAIDRASARPVNGQAVDLLQFSGELEGFELEIEPGAATFPDGRASGFVTATEVDVNHIPGRLPDGSAPAMLVSLEPGGTEFEPPCSVRFPNRTGLPPGTPVRIFGFEGALSEFEEFCAGEVTEDGTAVVSTESCVAHFSFVGFFPEASGDFSGPVEAEGFLEGRVVDALGNGIPGVRVDAAASEASALTDADGAYTIPLPRRNLFALRVFAQVPTSLASADAESQLAVYQSEPVAPDSSGTTAVPDIVVDRLFLSGDLFVVNPAGEFVTAGGASTEFDPDDGRLLSLSDSEAQEIRVWVLQAGERGAFDSAPLASGVAGAATTAPFSASRFVLTLAAGTQDAAGVRPGDWIQIVAFSPRTGYAGTTTIQVPDIAETGTADLRSDVVLSAPEVGIRVRRSRLNADGIPVVEAVRDGGRVANSDDFLEVATQYTVNGLPLPPIPGLALHGRFSTVGDNGPREQRFAVPPGTQTRVLELRSLFAPSAPTFNSARVLRSGRIDVSSDARFSGDRVLDMRVLGFFEADVTSQFTFDVTNITASPPDAGGLSLVAGSRGAAQADSPVDVLNEATQVSAATAADADAAFGVLVPASVGDSLRVLFTDVGGQPAVEIVTVPSVEREQFGAPVGLFPEPAVNAASRLGEQYRIGVFVQTSSGAIRGATPEDALVFQAANPAVATVDADGVVTVVGEGQTAIEVALGDLVARSELFVRFPPVATLSFSDAGGFFGDVIGLASGLARIGDSVRIEGLSAACDTPELEVTIGGVPAAIDECADGQATVTVAAGSEAGGLQVRTETEFSPIFDLQIVDGPILTKLDPGGATEGMTVRILGVGFDPVLANNNVRLDDTTTVSPTVLEAESISFVLPALDVSPTVVVSAAGLDSNGLPLLNMVPVDLQVSLPPGLSLTPDQTTVYPGAHVPKTPSPAGVATTFLVAEAPTATAVYDPAGNAVLLGFAHSSATFGQGLSTHSTADALIHLFTGFGSAPAGLFADLQTVVHQLPETAILRDAVEAYVVQSGEGLTGVLDDAAVTDALVDASGALIDRLNDEFESAGFAPTRTNRIAQWLEGLLERIVPSAHADGNVLPALFGNTMFPEDGPIRARPNELNGGVEMTAWTDEGIEIRNWLQRYVSARIERVVVVDGVPRVERIQEHVSGTADVLLALAHKASNVVPPAKTIPTIDVSSYLTLTKDIWEQGILSNPVLNTRYPVKA